MKMSKERYYEYGCEYCIAKTLKTLTISARNADEARLKMMRFAEKEDVHVQYLGRRIHKK